jgi:hypothetical protein
MQQQYTNVGRIYGNTTANPVLMAPLVAVALVATLGWLLLVAGPALAYQAAAATYRRRRRAHGRAAVQSAAAPAAPAPARYPAPARLADGRPVRYHAPALVPVAVPVVAPAPAEAPAPAPQQDTPAPATDRPAVHAPQQYTPAPQQQDTPPIPYGWGSVASPPPGTVAEEAARSGRPVWQVARGRRVAARKAALAAARELEPNAAGPLPAPVDQADRYHTGMTYRQLQQECKARGLSGKGNREALLLRLQAADRAAA